MVRLHNQVTMRCENNTNVQGLIAIPDYMTQEEALLMERRIDVISNHAIQARG